jgi:hypothetical protein
VNVTQHPILSVVRKLIYDSNVLLSFSHLLCFIYGLRKLGMLAQWKNATSLFFVCVFYEWERIISVCCVEKKRIIIPQGTICRLLTQMYSIEII